MKKIITKGDSGINSYKCDMTKSYEFADAYNLFAAIRDASLYILFAGIPFLLILAAKPTQGSETPRIIVLILMGILWLICIIFVLIGFIKYLNKKRELKIKLSNSSISTGTMLSIKFEQKGKMRRDGVFRMTIKLDGYSETINVFTNKKYWRKNQNVAVANCGDKEFILTKCTLIEI